jgi:hypothetical protein
MIHFMHQPWVFSLQLHPLQYAIDPSGFVETVVY